MAVTLTPGMESRLEGAPGVDLFADDLENRTQFWISQGADPQEARQLAAEDVAKMRDRRAREAEVASERAAREAQRATARMPDQRPIPVQEAELEYYQDQADAETAGYRQDGPTLRPGTPAWKARDRRMALDGAPFTRGASPDPIDNDASIRQWYEDTYGRPPQTPEEVEFARRRMVSNFQTAGGQRPASQAPQRWGSREKFNSPQEEEAYSLSRPGAPSQEEADMYASNTPMVLVYKGGAAGPMMAAPAPGPGDRYIDDTGDQVVRAEGTQLHPGVANETFMPDRQRRMPAGSPSPYPNQAVRTGMQSPGLRQPAEGMYPRLMEGPSGPQWVWDYPDTQQAMNRQKLENSLDRNDRRRYMAELGMSPADAEGKTMEEMRELSLAEREAKRFNQKAEARRMRSENARMNSGQLGLQMQQMDPDYRQIMLLDRLTQGRRGGATPLDVQAQNMENAMPVIRSALAGAMQSMDPQARSLQEMQTRAAILAMPPERQVAFSRMQGEEMGKGYSAAHVGERWKYWMLDAGTSSRAEREKGFRSDMTALGYSPEEIDAFIDARMNSPEGPPEPQEAAEYPQPEPGSPVLPSPTQPPPGRVWTPFGGMRR